MVYAVYGFFEIAFLALLGYYCPELKNSKNENNQRNNRENPDGW
jgi:hypothetical protein